MTFYANEADITWRQNGVLAAGTSNPALGQGHANASTRQVWENTLDNKGRIDGHDTAISALQNQGGKILVVADITARDALTGVLEGLYVHVIDDGDGVWAQYIATADGQGNWQKIADGDTPFTASADWTLITNKPAAFPPESHSINSHGDFVFGRNPSITLQALVWDQSANLWQASEVALGSPAFAPFSGSGSANGVARSDHNHTGVYAAASHAHSAGDITSGTLPVSRGGTGSAGPHTANKVMQSDGSGNIVASSVDIGSIGGGSGLIFKNPASYTSHNLVQGDNNFTWATLGIPAGSVPLIRMSVSVQYAIGSSVALSAYFSRWISGVSYGAQTTAMYDQFQGSGQFVRTKEVLCMPIGGVNQSDAGISFAINMVNYQSGSFVVIGYMIPVYE